MKKTLVLALLFLFGCETGVEINLECWIKHTAEAVRLQSQVLGQREGAIVNLTWGWIHYPGQKPNIDWVIVERSISDSTHYQTLDTLPVDSVMTFNDADTLLKPNMKVYYRLISLYGMKTDTFKVTAVDIPQAQRFYEPRTDTIGNDTLPIVFARLSGFSDYKMEIFRTQASNIESLFVMPVESLLLNLTSCSFDTTITDTVITLFLADNVFPNNEVYAIKLTSSKEIEYITDTSVGLRLYFKKE
ncbi:MAG: hypothetical protein ABIL15_02040 [candidate division WOR-3 bacterium]